MRLRPIVWVFIGVNVLFVAWIILGIVNGGRTECGNLESAACDAALGFGTALGTGFVLVAWAVVDIIVGVFWFFTMEPRTPRDVVSPGVPYQSYAAANADTALLSPISPDSAPLSASAARSKLLIQRMLAVTAVLVVTVGGTTAGYLIGKSQGRENPVANAPSANETRRLDDLLPTGVTSSGAVDPVGSTTQEGPGAGDTLPIVWSDGSKGLVTLESAKWVKKADGLYYSAPDSGNYLVVDITIESTEGTGSYNPFDITVRDASGQEFTLTPAGYEPALASGELPAGEKVRGKVSFDLKKGPATVRLSEVVGGPLATWSVKG